MVDFKRISLALMAGTASLALAACDGSTSVASPGEGTVVIPAPAPAPTPTPTATPTPSAGTPAASCPTGTNDVGVVGVYRACRLPAIVQGNLNLPKVANLAYEMNGRVDVGIDLGGSGSAPGGAAATLTVAPGVIIYANSGANGGAENDFLAVNRGSRILAEGTETQPIIFTSRQNVEGTANDESQGQWGGVILAGRAPISNCNIEAVGGSAGCENLVEGTENVRYGGANVTDNSGIMRYVQIRYSGTVISPNNELQGLTMGGTGSGTQIDHIQVHNSSDDGIEIFGGRTNLRYLVMTGADDDAFDTDVGWQGAAQFVLAIQKPGSTQTDNYGTEIDSNGSEDALPRQKYTLANFTFINTTAQTNAVIRLRGGADARFANGLVVGPMACINILASTVDGQKTTIRPANATLQDDGPPSFNSVLLSCANPFAATAVSGSTVTVEEQAAVFNAGTNNNANAGTVIQNGFYPAGAATSATAFNASTFNPSGSGFLIATNYVGAVSGPNDTWFQRWTCNSNRANFGTTSAACTALPN